MAIGDMIFAEGFEDPLSLLTTHGWVLISCNVTVLAHVGLDGEGGDQALVQGAFQTSLSPVFPDTARYMYIAMNAQAAACALYFYSPLGSIQGILYFDPGASCYRFYRGNFVAEMATSAPINPNVYHTFRITYEATSTGQFIAYMDGDFTTPAMDSGSGVNVQGAADADWSRLGVNGVQALFDDIAVFESAWTPVDNEVFIRQYFPDANGDLIELTPASGDNWEMVDDPALPPGDYNETTVVNKADRYLFPPLAWTPNEILGIAVRSTSVRDGAITTIAGSLNSGGTVYEQTPPDVIGGSGSTAGHSAYFAEDPDTSAPWTEAAVNALNAGIRFNG